MYRFETLENIDANKWDNNLLQSNYSTYFQTSEYLTHDIEIGYKYPIFIFVYDESDKIMGQLGIKIRKTPIIYSSSILKKFSILMSGLSNRATWVNGPIIFSENHDTKIKILESFIRALDFVATKNNLTIIDGYSTPQDLAINEEYLNTYKIHDYTVENFTTFVSELDKSVDELWMEVEKKARNDVTRAKRRNIIAKEVINQKEFLEYFQLTREWAKTKGMEISDRILEQKNNFESYIKGRQKFFLAYDNNELISGLRVLFFNGIAYTHEVLSSYSRPTSLGGTLLTWNAIEWAKNNGMRMYDFSGGKSPPILNSDEYHRWVKQWEGSFCVQEEMGWKRITLLPFCKNSQSADIQDLPSIL